MLVGDCRLEKTSVFVQPLLCMVELLENFAIVSLRVLRWPVSCTRPLLRIVWSAICLGGASGAIRAATCIVGFACDAMEVRFGTTEKMSRTSRMRWPKGCTRFSTRSMRRMPRGLPVTRLLPPPCLVVDSCVVEKNSVLACLAFHAFIITRLGQVHAKKDVTRHL